MAGRSDRAWIGPVALVLALMLATHPLPGVLAPTRPDWVALVIIYLGIHSPHRWVLAQALVAGLCLDAMLGTPLGQYALALSVCAYLPMKLHLRLALVPIWQTMLTALLFTAVYQFVLFWCNGTMGNEVGAVYYLWPLFSNVIVWPIVLLTLDRVSRSARRAD